MPHLLRERPAQAGRPSIARPRRRSRYDRRVKRSLAWLAGIAGIAALGRMLARRRQPAECAAEQPAAATLDDPAEELRRKLADQRQPAPAPAPTGESLEERRARIHAKAREAIEAMDDDGSGR